MKSQPSNKTGIGFSVAAAVLLGLGSTAAQADLIDLETRLPDISSGFLVVDYDADGDGVGLGHLSITSPFGSGGDVQTQDDNGLGTPGFGDPEGSWTGNYDLQVTIQNDGTFVGGSLTLVGDATIGMDSYTSTTLLNVDLLDMGSFFQGSPGTGTAFDFIGAVDTGSALETLWGGLGADVYVTIGLVNSGNAVDWTQDFSDQSFGAVSDTTKAAPSPMSLMLLATGALVMRLRKRR